MIAKILIEITLDLYLNLKSAAILTKLSLLIHEHAICFHLIKSLISLSNTFEFPVYISWTSLVKFILNYFIIFDDLVNIINLHFTVGLLLV
jgi:hypothetical protein